MGECNFSPIFIFLNAFGVGVSRNCVISSFGNNITFCLDCLARTNGPSIADKEIFPAKSPRKCRHYTTNKPE